MVVQQLINGNGNPVVNQFVIKTEKAVYFQSYKNVICKWDGINLILSNDWKYNNTTRKHLYIFLRQNGFYSLSSAKDIRKAIEKKVITLEEINII